MLLTISLWYVISNLPYSRCVAVDRHLGCLQWTTSEARGPLANEKPDIRGQQVKRGIIISLSWCVIMSNGINILILVIREVELWDQRSCSEYPLCSE